VRPSMFHYFPLAVPFLLFLLFLFAVLIILIEIGILRYAYAKLGVRRVCYQGNVMEP
jgi:uncharacterized membrane protein